MNSKKIFPFILLICLSLTACFPGKGPSKVAEEFLTAINHKDFDRARELSTPGSEKAINLIETFSGFAKHKPRTFEILREEIEAEYATVYFKESDSEAENSIQLKKDSKKGWLVMFSKANIPGEQNINGKTPSPEEVDQALKEFNEGMDELSEGLDSLGQKLGKGIEKLGEGLDKMGEEMQKKEK